MRAGYQQIQDGYDFPVDHPGHSAAILRFRIADGRRWRASPERAEAKTIETKRYAENIKGAKSARDVINNRMIDDLSNLSIPAQTALVLELK